MSFFDFNTLDVYKRQFPSFPVSMQSESETSPAVFRIDRKYMRISFAILS